MYRSGLLHSFESSIGASASSYESNIHAYSFAERLGLNCIRICGQVLDDDRTVLGGTTGGVVHLWDLRKAVGNMGCMALCGKDDPVSPPRQTRILRVTSFSSLWDP
jgi:hypothetical protein